MQYIYKKAYTIIFQLIIHNNIPTNNIPTNIHVYGFFDMYDRAQ